mgnify:CR=1 FL=1
MLSIFRETSRSMSMPIPASFRFTRQSPVNEMEVHNEEVNLRDLYPDVYKNDHFVEVTEDVLETIRAAERAEAAYDRRMYRYKAHYSLNQWYLDNLYP